MALVPVGAQSASSNQDRPSGYCASFSSDGGVSSADPKPRLRWTPELHERFVDAVSMLGGAESKLLTRSLSSITLYVLWTSQSVFKFAKVSSCKCDHVVGEDAIHVGINPHFQLHFLSCECNSSVEWCSGNTQWLFYGENMYQRCTFSGVLSPEQHWSPLMQFVLDCYLLVLVFMF